MHTSAFLLRITYGLTLYRFLITCFVCLLVELSAGCPSPKIETLRFEGIPSTIVNNVHIITGDYCERVTDLAISGSSPLKFTRTYCSGLVFGATIDSGTLHGFWNHNHYGALYLLGGKMADKYFTQKGGDIYNYHAYAFDSHGSSTFYENTASLDQLKTMDFQLKCGIVNHSFLSPEIPNWKSQSLIKEDKTYSITDGKCGFKRYKKSGKYTHLLKEEKLPSGNRLQYTFKASNDLLPKRVETYNSDNQTLVNSLKFNFKSLNGSVSGGKWQVHCLASNGQTALYNFKKSSGIIKTYHLMSVESNSAPTVEYEYGKKWRLTKRKLPEQRHKSIEYFCFKGEGAGYYNTTNYCMPVESGKVKVMKAPVGSTEKLITTDRFAYYCNPQLPNTSYSGRTAHFDALGNKTIYYFSIDHRLTRIERYENDLVSQEVYVWGESGTTDESNLLEKRLEDSSGRVHAQANYTYDKNGNLIEHRVFDNITYYTYNQNNLIETKLEANGRKTHFSYVTGTNLVKSTCVSFAGKIQIRIFYEYDANGTLLETITDDGKNTTERHIEKITPCNKLASKTKPRIIEKFYVDLTTNTKILQSKLIHDYDDRGRIIRTDTFDRNNELKYSIHRNYDMKGNLIKEKDTRGKTFTYRYDANHNKIYSCGPDKTLETFLSYDYSNRLIKKEQRSTDGEIRTESYTYDYLGNQISKTNFLGNTTRLEYNRFGCVTKMIQPMTLDENGAAYSPETIYAYDILGNLIFEQSAKGEITRKEYNHTGKATKIQYSDGTIEYFEYTVNGLLSKKIEGSGSYQEFTYDYQGQELTSKLFDVSGIELKRTSKTYNAFHIMSIINPEGIETTYDYDFSGRLVSTQKGDAITTYGYDSFGNQNSVSQKIDNQGNWKRENLVFDYYKRIIKKSTENESGQLLRKEHFVYNLHDQCIEEIHFRSGQHVVSKRIFSPFNEVLSFENELGNIWTAEYFSYQNILEQTSRLKRVTDPNGQQRLTYFDCLNRTIRLEVMSPYGEVLDQKHLFYDRAGNKSLHLHQVYFQGKAEKTISTIWEYGSMHRVKVLREAAGSYEEKVTRYFYDTVGRLARTIKPDGIELYYAYDGAGRRLNLFSSEGSLSYRYHYNKNDQPIKIENLANATSEKFEYDDLGILTREVLANGLEIKYESDLLGRTRKIIFPDKTAIEYDFNATDLKAVYRLDSSQKLLYQHTYYEHDLSGSCTSEILPFSLGTVNNRYDKLGRAQSSHHPKFSWNIDHFDPAGNLLAQTITLPDEIFTLNYEYDSLYQLTREEGLFNHSYSFDSLLNRRKKNSHHYQINAISQVLHDGLTTYRYDKCGNLIEKISPISTVQYSYDALNRLIRVEEDDVITSYEYDSQNRRIKKNNQRFLYFGQHEIGSMNTSDVIDELRMIENSPSKLDKTLAIELNGKVYIALHDCRRSIATLIAGTGEVEEQTLYSAFGEEKRFLSTRNPWRYSSKRIDEETGLVYFGMRYYNPHLGRWQTTDPAGFVDGMNLYAYVGNRSLMYFDLHGLFKTDAKLYKHYSELSTHDTQLNEKELTNMVDYASRDISRWEYTIEGKKHPTRTQGFGNGIWNSLQDAMQSAQMISNQSGGYEVKGIYNDSRGPGALKSIVEFFGYKTKEVMNIRTQFARSYLETIMQRNNGEDPLYNHSCHSQGAIQTYNALRGIPKAVQQHITVLNENGARIIPKKLCREVVNLRSSRDIIPRLDIRGQIKYHAQVQTIKAHPDAPLFDHPLSSPTLKRSSTEVLIVFFGEAS